VLDDELQQAINGARRPCPDIIALAGRTQKDVRHARVETSHAGGGSPALRMADVTSWRHSAVHGSGRPLGDRRSSILCKKGVTLGVSLSTLKRWRLAQKTLSSSF